MVVKLIFEHNVFNSDEQKEQFALLVAKKLTNGTQHNQPIKVSNHFWHVDVKRLNKIKFLDDRTVEFINRYQHNYDSALKAYTSNMQIIDNLKQLAITAGDDFGHVFICRVEHFLVDTDMSQHVRIKFLVDIRSRGSDTHPKVYAAKNDYGHLNSTPQSDASGVYYLAVADHNPNWFCVQSHEFEVI